jgi:hypothetical protein
MTVTTSVAGKAIGVSPVALDPPGHRPQTEGDPQARDQRDQRKSPPGDKLRGRSLHPTMTVMARAGQAGEGDTQREVLVHRLHDDALDEPTKDGAGQEDGLGRACLEASDDRQKQVGGDGVGHRGRDHLGRRRTGEGPGPESELRPADEDHARR